MSSNDAVIELSQVQSPGASVVQSQLRVYNRYFRVVSGVRCC